MDFLLNEGNTTELMHFLSDVIRKLNAGNKEICVTDGPMAYSTTRSEDGLLHILHPCSHVEADTRMMVHILDAVRNRSNDILVHTADTDVTVVKDDYIMQTWT